MHPYGGVSSCRRFTGSDADHNQLPVRPLRLCLSDGHDSRIVDQHSAVNMLAISYLVMKAQQMVTYQPGGGGEGR